MTWTVLTVGGGLRFDVSREVRKGAGGEGASVEDASLSSSPLSSLDAL